MSELYETVYLSNPPLINDPLCHGAYLFVGVPKLGKSFLMVQLIIFGQREQVIVGKDELVIVIDFKSQIGPSFGNNFINRTEEAMGPHLICGLPLEKAFWQSGDTILDSFCGSGTTMIAAIKSQRNSIRVETEVIYCDYILSRIDNKYGSLRILSYHIQF